MQEYYRLFRSIGFGMGGMGGGLTQQQQQQLQLQQARMQQQQQLMQQQQRFVIPSTTSPKYKFHRDDGLVVIKFFEA